MSSGYNLILETHNRAIRGGQEADYGEIKPFPPYAYSDPEKLLNWLEGTCATLQNMQRDRAWQMLENISFYNGVQHMIDAGWEVQDMRDIRGNYLNDSDIFVMNHARDFVNQKVAMLTRFKPAVNVVPWNSTYRDRLGAKFSKRAIDTIFYHNEIASVARDVAFHASTCGEGYARVYWDPHMGDITEEQAQRTIQLQAQLAEKGGDVTGKEQLARFEQPDGSEVFLDIQDRTGDVRVESVYPWLILKEPAQTWKDVNYVFQLTVKHIEQVQLENPGIDIQTNAGRVDGKSHLLAFSDYIGTGDYVVEVEFFHRSVPLLDNGFYAKFIGGTLLEQGPLLFSNGELPFARLTDYDDLMTPHGRAFLNDIRPPLILHNKLLNLMYRNVAIAGHPKMMVQRGTVNINSMGSGPYIVEYDGGAPPQIMTFNSISGEVFTLSRDFMGQIQQVAGVFGLSRGDTIPNARAAEILSIYQEQEEQRNGVQTDKYIAWIEKVARLSKDCASDNYKADDKRSLKIFGKNNRYKLRQLTDVSSLKGPSDVIVERTTSLDDTRQGKINKIVQLSQIPLAGQEGPGIFKKEQIIRMLDLADSETFIDLYTAAVDAAESENEDMYEGLPVPEPQPYQNNVIHWNQHFLFMQSKEFADTTSVPDEVRQAFVNHMLVTEMYMYEKAKASLAYAQELMTLQNFPCFLKIGPESVLPETQLTIAQIIMMHQTPPMPSAPLPTEGQQQ